jgi:hypothetical protein
MKLSISSQDLKINNFERRLKNEKPNDTRLI